MAPAWPSFARPSRGARTCVPARARAAALRASHLTASVRERLEQLGARVVAHTAGAGEPPPEAGPEPVGPGLTSCFSVAATPLAPRAARSAAAELTWIPPRMRDDTALLLTELVTNSVRHADLRPGDGIAVTIVWDGHRLRVEVADPGPGFVPPAGPEDRLPAPGGLGLVLVERLADRWSVQRRDRRTRVSFELA